MIAKTLLLLSFHFPPHFQSVPSPFSAADPFRLKEFCSKSAGQSQSKWVRIQSGSKIPERPILPFTQETIWQFDSLARPISYLEINRSLPFSPDTMREVFFYEENALSSVYKWQNGEEERSYYTSIGTSSAEIKCFIRNSAKAAFRQHDFYNIQHSMTPSGWHLWKQYHGDQLQLMSYALVEDEQILEIKLVKPGQNGLIHYLFEYDKGQLSRLVIDESGFKHYYEYHYKNSGELEKTTHTTGTQLTEVMEYFYYKGRLESTLKTRPGSDELIITNFSYR